LNKKCFSALCASVLAVVFFACKEDVGNVGLNVQPQDELLNTIFFDTASIRAYSTVNDSVITSNAALNLLGDADDPVFGRTQAAIYTQFCLSAPQVDFGGDALHPYVDSLVLNLVYGGHYGDTMQALQLRVYELNEDLKPKTVYYGHSTAAKKSELLGEIQIQPKPNTPNDTSSTAAYFSIRLDNGFARDKFLAKSGKSELYDDANFISYFKGFYIEAEAVSPNGCMLSINLLHARSTLTLYYGNDKAPNQKFSFKIKNDTCVRFSHINHFGYAGVEANLSAQLGGDYSTTNEVLYGQSAGGIKTVIQFPHLKAMFAGKQVVIHKAELIITRKDDALPHYGAPALLSLSYDHLLGKNLQLFDDKFGAAYFGGTYNETTKQYAFRITKYVQQLLSDEKGDDYRLNLIVAPAAIRLSRSMYYGTAPAADNEKRIKLKINYTVINK
jgi:hypothetical protein